jgi:hypothetical protein
MFIHPAPSCRVLAHERRQALKRAASFWEPDPDGRNETGYVPFVGGNGGNGPCFSRVNVL